ncbi:MAG: hypothetical protein ACK5L8_03465 [Marinicella pacifica]
MNSNNKIQILFCAEQGIIERQSILLSNSIHKTQCLKSIHLHAYSPRKHFQPLRSTILFYKNNQICHHRELLNQKFTKYPIANKLLACADFEKNNPEAKSIMFVDTDTVFLNPMGSELFTSEPSLYLRPVDNKGPGSESNEDKNDAFWQAVFKQFKLPIPKPDLMTTVRPSTIRPYFNAGFIWADNIPGFYQQWLEDFLKLVDSGLRPYGYQSRDGDDFRCLDQVALAVTASRFQEHVKILPETYNYPIPFRPFMKDRDTNKQQKHPDFKDLVHIHYHKWFQHPGFLDHVTSEEDKQTEQYRWLKKQLPLQPTIDGPFKC